MNLILVGLRGSGKTELGKTLAKRLSVDFVDVDHMVEKSAARSIGEIFTQSGEGLFRRLEGEALARLEGTVNTVVATGGGIVLQEENRRFLKQLGKVVWLEVSPLISVARTRNDGNRPRLTALSPSEEAAKILEVRRCFYEEVADVSISTDNRSIEEICDELEQFWNSL